MDKEAKRAHHDLGGASKYMCEKVDIEPHGLTAFDREVDALRQMLAAKKLMSVDELRRGIEALPEADYHRLTYYQRWIHSITDNLLRSGVITQAELAKGAGGSLMFRVGDAVRVKDEWPEAVGPVHIRTPHYVRGVAGEVTRFLGEFPNPEDLAFARPAERRPLYHVRFRKGAIWPEAKPDDNILIEIFGHWLEKP